MSYVINRAKQLEKLKLKSNTASELTQLHLGSVNGVLGPHSSITHVTSVNLTVNLKQQTWTLFAPLKELAEWNINTRGAWECTGTKWIQVVAHDTTMSIGTRRQQSQRLKNWCILMHFASLHISFRDDCETQRREITMASGHGSP